MKIEKAIETNEVTIGDEFTTLHLDQLEAIKLGIEALKAVQESRYDQNPTHYHLLPGETGE